MLDMQCRVIPKLPTGEQEGVAQFEVTAAAEILALAVTELKFKAVFAELLPGAFADAEARAAERTFPRASSISGVPDGEVAFVLFPPRGWLGFEDFGNGSTGTRDFRVHVEIFPHLGQPMGRCPVVVVEKADNLASRFREGPLSRFGQARFFFVDNAEKDRRGRRVCISNCFGPGLSGDFSGFIGRSIVDDEYFP